MTIHIPSFVSFITESFLFTSTITRTLFYTMAVILIASKLFQGLRLLKGMIVPLFSYKPNLGQRYGKGSWVVITGASDGIGKTFAFELASHDFNIALVARNREKLEGVEKELKAAFPSVKTRIVVQDFKDSYKENFAEEIYNQVKDLDVSFLINNAGKATKGMFIEKQIPEIRELILVNSLAPALITRAFLPHLSGRKKSAVITVSSIAGAYPRTDMQLYSASKAFVDFISRGLIGEHKNIDFLSLRPAAVSTKMTGKSPGGKVVTTEACVKSSLRSLGHADYTYGDWRHSLQAFVNMNRSDDFKRNVARK